MMNSADVVNIYDELKRLGIGTWIDGGWAADALLGEETRPHEDVDIVIEQKDILKLRELLEVRGYHDVPRDDTSAWNFVLGDAEDHLVDVHAVVLDEKGNGLYGPKKMALCIPRHR